jgi:signal transduction histidine kinase
LPERLPPAVEVAAYYVVAEALTNVARYAHASRATVHVAQSDGHALVEVSDDGAGGADPSVGSGLRGLADRIDALDGSLTVQSAPGGGTRNQATIPLAARAMDDGAAVAA